MGVYKDSVYRDSVYKDSVYRDSMYKDTDTKKSYAVMGGGVNTCRILPSEVYT